MEQDASTAEHPAIPMRDGTCHDEASRARTIIEIATHRFQTPIVRELTRPPADAHVTGQAW